MDDSVPRCFFTRLPRSTKDLKLLVHKESSQTDITEKSTHLDKNEKYTKIQYTTHTHELYNGTLPLCDVQHHKSHGAGVCN